MTDPEVPGGDPQSQGERDDKPELDIDSAFAAIVADFALPVPHGVGPWPAAEDLDEDDDRPDAGDTPPGPADRADRPDRPDLSDPARPGPAAEGWRPPVRRIQVPGEGLGAGTPGVPAAPGARDDEDDEEGYEPPEPPPLPRGDPVSRLAWGAVIGGPLFLLVAALTWRSLPTVLLLLALLAFVGGFVTLVARMPQEPPDDPDDGAVV